jgi:hypothetical protein
MLGRPFTLATVSMPPSIVVTMVWAMCGLTRSPPKLTLMGESGAYDHMLVITEWSLQWTIGTCKYSLENMAAMFVKQELPNPRMPFTVPISWGLNLVWPLQHVTNLCTCYGVHMISSLQLTNQKANTTVARKLNKVARYSSIHFGRWSPWGKVLWRRWCRKY